MDLEMVDVPGPCADCPRAAGEVWHGFTYGCRGCRARAAARSQPARQRRVTGRDSGQFRDVCDLYGVTPAEVRDAAAADRLPAPGRMAQTTEPAEQGETA